MSEPVAPGTPAPAPRYLRPLQPLHFPTSAEMPESRLHADLRALLYHLLRDHVGTERATFGTDQFVYWDASDPRQCLAPDALVKVGPADAPFGSWKVWERGAPDVAVELVSESDQGAPSWAVKLERYRALGVTELLRFDGEAPPGQRLRQWERVEGDLIERALEGDRASGVVLDLDWVVGGLDEAPVALRITAGRGAAALVPSRAEARRAAEEARRAAEAARDAAEARVAALEAELARRGG